MKGKIGCLFFPYMNMEKSRTMTVTPVLLNSTFTKKKSMFQRTLLEKLNNNTVLLTFTTL